MNNYQNIYNTRHKKLGPIMLFRSNDIDDAIPYKVAYGTSTFYFKTYGEAMQFIKSRFKDETASKGKYFPLIETDDDTYMPLFPFNSRKEAFHFEFYLERISDDEYTLHRGKSMGDYPSKIGCPFCGQLLNKINTNATEKYVCFSCRNEK